MPKTLVKGKPTILERRVKQGRRTDCKSGWTGAQMKAEAGHAARMTSRNRQAVSAKPVFG
jgi:hypothetical protein